MLKKCLLNGPIINTQFFFIFDICSHTIAGDLLHITYKPKHKSIQKVTACWKLLLKMSYNDWIM